MPDQLPILRWMQGTGNRFALVNQSELQGWKPSMLAQVLGSGDRDLDGLLVLKPAHGMADVQMKIFNADGSEAWMCGNGLRCVIFDRFRQNNMDKETVRIEVGQHVLSGRVLSCSRQEAMVCTRMPVPTVRRVDELVQVDLGNAHVLVMQDQMPSDDVWQSQVRELQSRGLDDVNLHAVQVLSEDVISMRSWERGVGPTLACASGATAAVAGLSSFGRIGNAVLVHQPGGQLGVRWRGPGTQPLNVGKVGDLENQQHDSSMNEYEATPL